MLDLKAMLKAGVHFGHKTSRWSPQMRKYIWGARNKIHLFDISKTSFLLERAGAFLKEIVSTGGSIMWIGTKRPAQTIIKKVADDTQTSYVIHRWIGGTLTNHEQVKKAMTRLLHLRDIVEKSLDHYGKKEQSMLQKELYRLEKNVGGILDLSFPPSVLIVVDARKERSAIKEATKMGIPIIAMVDSNTDPESIPFVIPANDDSPKSISFVIDYLTSCFHEGATLFEEAEKKKAEEKATAKEAKKAGTSKKVEVKAEEKVVVKDKKEKVVKAKTETKKEAVAKEVVATEKVKTVSPETSKEKAEEKKSE